MTRFIMFVFITALSVLSLFGCAATLHQTEPTTHLASFDDGPPLATAETPRHERTVVAESGSINAACNSDRTGYRTRFVHRSVSTRDGTRVYCF